MKNVKTDRRNLVKGAAWAAPIVVATSAIPAYAASKRGTATNTTGQYYHVIKSVVPFACNATTNPQTGYIDNRPDGKNDPASSQGYWIESPTAGTVTNVSITTTYTFNHPITITSGMVTNGWTITLSADKKVITATYSAAEWQVSTGVLNSGTSTGFYIPFKINDGCFSLGGVTVNTSTTMTYVDANGPQTFTKNTSRGI